MPGKPPPLDHPSPFAGWSRGRRYLLAFLALLSLFVTITTMLVLLISTSPQTGAQGADWLRGLLGNKPVAELEAVVFTIQDKLHQLVYRVEASTPSAPWESSSISPVTSRPAASGTSASFPALSTHHFTTATPARAALGTQEIGNQPAIRILPTSTPQPAATTMPTPSTWLPPNLVPLGSIPGEGIWTAYLDDPSGLAVAYRTFLQPDPSRPYVTVGIVAFDLSHLRLHYVPGLLEPVSIVNLTHTLYYFAGNTLTMPALAAAMHAAGAY
jgi:hypothetical protein